MSKDRKYIEKLEFPKLIKVREDVIINVDSIDDIVKTCIDPETNKKTNETFYKINLKKNVSPYSYVLLTKEDYNKYLKKYFN
jgi:hypothetical protein